MKEKNFDLNRFVGCENVRPAKVYMMRKGSDICPACGNSIHDPNHVEMSEPGHPVKEVKK